MACNSPLCPLDGYINLLSASVVLFIIIVVVAILVVVLGDLLVSGDEGRRERVEHQRWRRQRLPHPNKAVGF